MHLQMLLKNQGSRTEMQPLWYVYGFETDASMYYPIFSTDQLTSHGSFSSILFSLLKAVCQMRCSLLECERSAYVIFQAAPPCTNCSCFGIGNVEVSVWST